MPNSDYETTTTRVGKFYICRVSFRGKPLVQTRVSSRDEVGPAFRDLLRTIDKLGGDAFTAAARGRKWREGNSCAEVRHEWL